MGRRWTDAEELGMAEIRSRLKDLIAEQTPFPEGMMIHSFFMHGCA